MLRKHFNDPTNTIYPDPQQKALYRAVASRWLADLTEETRSCFNLLFDHYVHDSIAGFKRVLDEEKFSFVEASRWTINRKIFLGKRNKKFLYWRYEGWNPEYEAAKIAFEQQEAREAALAQVNMPSADKAA